MIANRKAAKARTLERRVPTNGIQASNLMKGEKRR
jgi:hypothetical protein